MINRTSTRRTDEELRCLLYDTANWTVMGLNGAVLREVASLHCGVQLASERRGLGFHVMALLRKGDPDTIVFSGQLEKLIDDLPKPAGSLAKALQAVRA